MLAISSTLAKRCNSEVGRCCFTNSDAASSTDWPFCFASSFTNASTPSDIVGPGSTEFTVTAVPRVISARPRDTASCGLGHTVMDHFLRNIQRGFGGDENDAAPIALQHTRHVGARQPHARHHIDLEE